MVFYNKMALYTSHHVRPREKQHRPALKVVNVATLHNPGKSCRIDILRTKLMKIMEPCTPRDPNPKAKELDIIFQVKSSQLEIHDLQATEHFQGGVATPFSNLHQATQLRWMTGTCKPNQQISHSQLALRYHTHNMQSDWNFSPRQSAMDEVHVQLTSLFSSYRLSKNVGSKCNVSWTVHTHRKRDFWVAPRLTFIPDCYTHCTPLPTSSIVQHNHGPFSRIRRSKCRSRSVRKSETIRCMSPAAIYHQRPALKDWTSEILREFESGKRGPFQG